MDEIPASDFDGSAFDAREFVQRYRKRLPLSQLQKGLRSHQASTKQELIDLINEKYGDFVSLSSRMQGVERALKPLRAPLEESSELTRHLHSRLGALLEEADKAHSSLANVRSRKEALKTYIDNARLLDAARATAEKQWGNPQESDDFLREHVAHESVSRDLRKIRLNLGGKPSSATETKQAVSQETARDAEGVDVDSSPECVALLAEAAAFESSFAERLRERLHGLTMAAKRVWDTSAASKAADVGPPRMELLAIAHLCRALSTLGRCDVVEEVFADVFVKGVLEDAEKICIAATEEQQKLTLPEAGGLPSSAPLSVHAGAVDLGPFFSSVESALLSEGAPLLWLARRLQGGSAASSDAESVLLAVPSLCLISNVGVASVLKQVQKVWPTVFMPASPDVFAANYGHAANFIRAAKALMTVAEQQSLAESAVLVDFQRRWKTQVYSALRTKEAVQRLDAAAKVADAQGTELRAQLFQLIETIWSDQWYLDILYPKMMQLTLDLLARYGKRVSGIAGGPDVPGAWDAVATPPTWTAASNPVRLPRAAAHLFELLAGISCTPGEEVGCLARLALNRAPDGPEGRPAELARALFREADTALRPTLDDLEAAMLRQVAAATTPQFSSIRGIPAFYRMLNKPVPTKASPYVEPCMRPIEAFREVASQAAPPGAVKGWVQRAVDGAAGEFSTQAAQLMESLRQQEASFRRLSGKTNAGEAGLTDLDKIHIQLCLDIDTFTAAAAALGVAPEGAPNLRKLTDTVAPVRSQFEAYLNR